MRRGVIAVLILPMLAGIGLGVAQPQQARAGDTLKVLAGVAAGVLVYQMLDKAEPCCCEVHCYCRDCACRCRWEGGCIGDCHPGRGHGPARRAYNHGYRDGWQDGERVGYRRGYRDGYSDGCEDQWEIDRRERTAWREPEPWTLPRRR